MKHSEAFEKLVKEIMPHVNEVSVDDVKGRLDSESKFHLVDVREDCEWDKSHITGSIHLGRGVIERDIEKTIEDRSSTVILYCGGGYRSALAAFNIQKMGYTNVFSMAGGIRKWRECGYPESN